MEEKEFENWVNEIKQKIPKFLDLMSLGHGKYKFSLSGDLIKNKNSGLGNTIFALKTIYSLNLNGDYNEEVNFIENFKDRDGNYFDKEIKKRSLLMRIYKSFLTFDKTYINYEKNKRAETRQAIATLFYFNKKNINYKFFANNEFIKKYFNSLNWDNPWESGSHLSHLIFFISVSNLKNKKKLINYTFNLLDSIKQKDGGWYTGEPDISEKINGVMKIFTAINAAKEFGKVNIKINNSKEIIDLALKAKNNRHACDNFNIIYVLSYAHKFLKVEYRKKEIDDFMKRRLDIFKKYYYPKYGAFSFYINKANDYYYSAKVSKGKSEPDIHGTAMFIWGITVIANYLNISNKLKIKEMIV